MGPHTGEGGMAGATAGLGGMGEEVAGPTEECLDQVCEQLLLACQPRPTHALILTLCWAGV